MLQDQVLDDVGLARRITDGGVPNPANGHASSGAPGDEAGDPGTTPAEQQQQQQQQPDLRHRPADIACALNFGLCLLHTPHAALAYLRCVLSYSQQAKIRGKWGCVGQSSCTTWSFVAHSGLRWLWLARCMLIAAARCQLHMCVKIACTCNTILHGRLAVRASYPIRAVSGTAVT